MKKSVGMTTAGMTDMINVFYLGRDRSIINKIRNWKNARLVRYATRPGVLMETLKDPHEPRADIVIVDSDLGLSVGGVPVTGELILRRIDKLVTNDVRFLLVVARERLNQENLDAARVGLSDTRELTLVAGGE